MFQKEAKNLTKVTTKDLSISDNSESSTMINTSTKHKKRDEKLESKKQQTQSICSVEDHMANEEGNDDDHNGESQSKIVALLSKLTKNFKLTFKAIKDSTILDEPPLEDLDEKQIKKIIRV
jgi:hypothetical protein